ncbi:MAG: hypothetical protein J6T62_06120 [Fibrobacter sp.]|nr:hypothetical protein [Fibrobacter sp.]
MKAKRSKIQPNEEILKYYFYFIQERMNVFWHKLNGESNLTEDPILKKYKFTNVYRACDRTSQYLIKNVIYKDISAYSAEDVLLRILIFKIFNKIETWDYLSKALPEPITIKSFDPHFISQILSKRQKNYPIFNNAYMMTGSHQLYNYLSSKHEKWLTMVKKEFIDTSTFSRILEISSLGKLFNLLRAKSFLGDFLAYQYSIDFNYSPFINFSENSFVKAGIGAIRGIKKCFKSNGNNFEDAIIYVHENFDDLQKKYGYTEFKPIPGHLPTLIDLQNCFCETDKYLREKKPELVVDNVRIKQKYTPQKKSLCLFFPPKWNVGDKKCILQNFQE